ncbi:MAG: hypothetical protein KKH33_06830 [Alphaproteobacteria bacterium]|nr:hypothetical protein [Alphaproteobacteria bacterium]
MGSVARRSWGQTDLFVCTPFGEPLSFLQFQFPLARAVLRRAMGRVAGTAMFRTRKWIILGGSSVAPLRATGTVAQTTGQAPPSKKPQVDVNGVDLPLESIVYARRKLAIGPLGKSGLQSAPLAGPPSAMITQTSDRLTSITSKSLYIALYRILKKPRIPEVNVLQSGRIYAGFGGARMVCVL